MPVPEDHRPVTFDLLVAPGVTADKWALLWSERLPDVDLRLVPAEVAVQASALLDSRADAGLVRLPVDRDVFDAIPLYTETTVVVVPRDHVITAADEVTAADLADETRLLPLDDVLAWAGAPGAVAADSPATTAAAVELVAAGVGVLVVPQSLARLHHRRDLTYRVITDAPTSSVALAWVSDRHTDLVEQMIGIVRGRTANSTRGRAQGPAAPTGVPAATAARPPAEGAAPRRTPPSGRGGATSSAGRGGTRRGKPTPNASRRRRGR